ncbi:phosphatidylinositol 4,5-bisphosphate 5-phosphatase A-like [Lytechinus variegatus]|uniref:phosphatidylinositol 4,5-bisphosphate 5-phosphatase A-like n=1 Tax=Lytechinus variegatus TaxID=7654 RepID=UPI001BB12DF9|nr:phosphatidylinositol 4,5-bisphosphate 5-phosphatase A-like [Lytechinus variegatus]
MAELRICVSTWNVATQEPPPIEAFKDMIWIQTQNAPDMYIWGLQEVSSKPHEFIQSAFSDDPWTEVISSIVCPKGYVMINSVRLQGLVILLYVRMLHLPFIHNVQTALTRTGLGGVWGNKGAVTIRFDCYGRSICLLNVHLSPHQDGWEKRDKEFQTIVSTQEFPQCNPTTILDHDYVLWFGDLNYRIEDLSTEAIKFLAAPKKLHVLLEKDQLLNSMRKKKAFSGFHEGLITFMPTYKFDLKSNEYDTSPKQRSPAWTDRILWKVNLRASIDQNYLSITQTSYTSHSDILWSDHRPVSAEFLAKITIEDAQPLVSFTPIESWSRGQDAECSYTVLPDTKTSNWDWVGLYKVGFNTAQKHYITYVWADSNGETDTGVGRVKFGASYLPEDTCSKYVLCYVSRTMSCVLGVSNVFRILPSDAEERQLQQTQVMANNAMSVTYQTPM